MSRHIAQEDIDSGNLTTDEVLYLQDRGLLPEDITPLKLRYSEGLGIEDPEETEDDAPEQSGDYGEGWTNVQRRAELTERGLSVEGKKEDLIARLLRSDAEELTDDDVASSD